MKNFLKSFAVSSFLTTLTLGVSINMAQANGITLGQPGYGGNGCPAGSADATLSPDQKSITILFDQFLVEAGSNGKRLDRKSCNIAIPVHVPQGFSVSIVDVDYRGYVSLPKQAEARLSSEYFFAGGSGPKFVRQFLGRTDEDYEVRDTLGILARVWSPCGASTLLRVNTSMLVRTNSKLEDALATVDSADIQAGTVYHLQFRTCDL
jgi:hypothetical protein